MVRVLLNGVMSCARGRVWACLLLVCVIGCLRAEAWPTGLTSLATLSTDSYYPTSFYGYAENFTATTLPPLTIQSYGTPGEFGVWLFATNMGIWPTVQLFKELAATTLLGGATTAKNTKLFVFVSDGADNDWLTQIGYCEPSAGDYCQANWKSYVNGPDFFILLTVEGTSDKGTFNVTLLCPDDLIGPSSHRTTTYISSSYSSLSVSTYSGFGPAVQPVANLTYTDQGRLLRTSTSTSYSYIMYFMTNFDAEVFLFGGVSNEDYFEAGYFERHYCGYNFSGYVPSGGAGQQFYHFWWIQKKGGGVVTSGDTFSLAYTRQTQPATTTPSSALAFSYGSLYFTYLSDQTKAPNTGAGTCGVTTTYGKWLRMSCPGSSSYSYWYTFRLGDVIESMDRTYYKGAQMISTKIAVYRSDSTVSSGVPGTCVEADTASSSLQEVELYCARYSDDYFYIHVGSNSQGTIKFSTILKDSFYYKSPLLDSSGGLWWLWLAIGLPVGITCIVGIILLIVFFGSSGSAGAVWCNTAILGPLGCGGGVAGKKKKGTMKRMFSSRNVAISGPEGGVTEEEMSEVSLSSEVLEKASDALPAPVLEMTAQQAEEMNAYGAVGPGMGTIKTPMWQAPPSFNPYSGGPGGYDASAPPAPMPGGPPEAPGGPPMSNVPPPGYYAPPPVAPSGEEPRLHDWQYYNQQQP